MKVTPNRIGIFMKYANCKIFSLNILDKFHLVAIAAHYVERQFIAMFDGEKCKELNARSKKITAITGAQLALVICQFKFFFHAADSASGATT